MSHEVAVVGDTVAVHLIFMLFTFFYEYPYFVGNVTKPIQYTVMGVKVEAMQQ